MNHLVRKGIMIAVVLLLVAIVGVPTAYSQSDNTIYMVFDEDVAFRLPAYGTIISFAQDYRLTKFEWDKWNASMIYFYNIQMDGDEVTKVGFSVENANLTIVDLFVDLRLVIELSAPSGTDSIVTIYVDDYGKPTFIKRSDTETEFAEVTSLTDFEGCTDCWYYDSENEMLYVKVRHHSVVPVMVSWEPLGEETTTSPPPPEAPETPWITYLVIIISVISVMALFIMSMKATRHIIYEERKKRKYVKKKQ